MDVREDPGPGGGDGFALNGARTRIRADTPTEVSGPADASESPGLLSAREAEVMSLIADGRTNGDRCAAVLAEKR